MSPSLDFAMIGMKAAIDQMERTGEQLAQLVSETNVVDNVVDLLQEQRSFEANAASARAADETLGKLIDLFI